MNETEKTLPEVKAQIRRLEAEVERLRAESDGRRAVLFEKAEALRLAELKLDCFDAEIGRLQALDESVKRAYKLILDREGAVQVEPIDELVKARLDLLKEMEAHHQEHHDREQESEAKYKVVVNGAVNLVGLACDKHRCRRRDLRDRRVRAEVPSRLSLVCLGRVRPSA